MEALESRRLLTIAIQFDYTYDTGNFFDAGRKAVLQAAADALGSRLLDTLDAIPAPSGDNSWIAGFLNPTDGTTQEQIPNLQVPADTLKIFVGGRTFASPSQRGLATSSFSTSGNAAWNDLVKGRGESGATVDNPTDVGPWGGSIGFDSSAGANWYFGLDGAVPAGQIDFFTLAQHEIGHILGFVSGSGSWGNLISGNTFTGAASTALYGGPVPADPAGGHWQDGTLSNGSPTTMDPASMGGTRTAFTPLDFAALDDIGWELGNAVATPTVPPGIAAPRTVIAGIEEVVDVSPPPGFAPNSSTQVTIGTQIVRAGRDASKHLYVEVSNDGGATFGGRETLPDTSNFDPVLVNHRDALLMAFTGENGHVYLDLRAEPFHPTWGPVVDTGKTSGTRPTLTSFAEKLYVGWDSGFANVVLFGRIQIPLQVAPVANGVLTLDGDQRAVHFDDVVTVERATGDGIKVTFNDNVFDFATGALSGIVINTGAGNNVVNLLDEIPEAPITINGGGTDTLHIGTGLPAVQYTPAANGLSGYGTLNIGGAAVHFAGLEFVTPVAPAAVQLAAVAIDENGVATLTGTFTDPGSFSTHTLSINWGDGSSAGPTSLLIGTRSFTATHQYLDDNPTGTSSDVYTISATVTDNDNLSGTGMTGLTVRNVTPILASFTGGAPSSAPAGEGQLLTVAGAFTDVGTLDTHTATIDWNDGTTSAGLITEAGGSGNFSAQHAFGSGGIYTVGVSLLDDDTGQTGATTTVFVTGVGVQLLNGKKTLVVVGTNGNDVVLIDRTKGGFKVRASFLTSDRLITTAGIEMIEVVLLGGDDRVTLPGSVTVPAIIDGGAGADTFYGGGGNNILIGGPGADLLIGGSARDLMIGGSGADRIVGNGNDDILIAGTTSYDSAADADKLANDGILLKLLEEWNSSQTYVTRVSNLRAGSGPVLGGTGRSLTSGLTVFNDADVDQLNGSSGLDWFFFDPSLDKASDRAAAEATN